MVDFVTDIHDGFYPDLRKKEHGQEPEKVTEKEGGEQEYTYKDQGIDFPSINDNFADKIV
jgi:hypothetical protein